MIRYKKAGGRGLVKKAVFVASGTAATLAIAVVVACCGSVLAAGRPNILLIVADDMGYSDASPYGGEIFTPNVARLANQGMMFTNFHVAAYCAPTRAMLLTGADNHLVGLGNMIELAAGNQLGKPGYEGYLNKRAATLATMLKGAGYHTYTAGKWHLGTAAGSIPADQGFERSVGVLEGGAITGRTNRTHRNIVQCIFSTGASRSNCPPTSIPPSSTPIG